MPSGSSELELLTIQAEGSFDPRGRIVGLYGVAVACCTDGQAVWIGADVPDALARELSSLAAAARADDVATAAGASIPPAILERCRWLLDDGGRALALTSSLSFVIGDDVRFDAGVRLERSDGPGERRAALADANPGGWHPVEWRELLDGALGPWAMALVGPRVVSICHTPRPPSARGAECGVWTDAAFRGRGYAAAVTAAWAALLRPSGRRLFYGCDADNASSQRVAQRLQLRAIGRTWRLGTPLADGGVHPLSSVRAR